MKILICLMLLAVPYTQGQYSMTVTVTAYCPCKKCCGKWADGKTRTGRNARFPGVAVDPRFIPLGSKLSIPGYNNNKWVLADDIGGAIKKRRIDIRFKTHKEALKWGIKKIKILIRK